MYAILQCARSDDLCHRHSDSIAICTDSQAALKALASPNVTSPLVAETVAALRELAIHNSVRLVWVPGHHGIPGNEAADVLAKQASAQPYIGPEPVLGVTSTTSQPPRSTQPSTFRGTVKSVSAFGLSNNNWVGECRPAAA